MKNKEITIGRLIITLLMLVITVVGGTYAWLNYTSKKSTLVLTIGDINDTKIILKPYEIREVMTPVTTYISGVYSEVETVNNGNSSTSISLYYKINELDQNLAKGGLKYTITSSTTKDGEYEEVKTGDFSQVDTDDTDALILETKVDPSSRTYYRVYLWLDSSVGNQTALQNTNLDMELNGTITQEATVPVLVNGMIPVVIDNDGTVSTISSDSKNWYDYGNKKWANIVLVSNSSRSNYEGTTGKTVTQSDILGYYVWIPRYRYKIWTTGTSSTGKEQMINLVFEAADDPMTLSNGEGEYRTHPAFWFDGDNDGVVDNGETLAGIWVGKFETTGSNTNPTVLPNALPLINQNVSSMFATSLLPSNGIFNSSTGKIAFSDASNGINIMDSTYGLAINADSHMMKNSEWGAVAYLSRSQYGINDEVRINNYYNSGYKTGCGASSVNGAAATSCTMAYGSGARHYPQSTTGNITGIFDMSGGANEYVMGNYANNVGNSGFTKLPDSKYYDLYANTSIITACNSGMCFGHALSETASWYSDTSQFVSSSSNSWLLRGGNYGLGSNAGIFYSNGGTGNADGGFRLILITLPTYTVSYNSNTGTGTPSNQIKVYGVDLTLSSTVPTKTSYTFKGWNTAANGSGMTYMSGGTYSNNENATLYAVWKDEELPSASITATNNVATYQTVTLTMSDEVGVTSYYFGKSDPNTTSVTWSNVTSATSVTKTQQVNSDGKWYLGVKDAAGNMTVVSKVFYKTTMSIQNGSVSPSTIITMSENTFTLPTPTANTNYTFDGWYTASDYSGSAITTHKPTANATIYGKVTANNLSGGSVSISGTNTVGSTLTANVNDTSPIGTYTYQWWTATSANATSGSTISGATASTFKLTSSQVGKYIGVTVTANKTNYYSKTFSDITESTNNTYATVMNLATIPTAANYCNSLTYNGSSQTLTKTAGSGYTFSNNTGTNAGNYTVTATLSTNYIWSDGATGTKTFNCSISSKSVTITAKDQTITQGNSIATGTGQITVSGLVSGHSVTAITLTPSTTDITTSGTITPSVATIKDSSSNNVTTNYNITYNAGKLVINKKVTATLKYYNNLSTTQSCSISSGTTCSITMPSSASASPSGYTFKGFSTSETCNSSTSYVGTSVSLSDNATYYACYSKNVTATFYYSTLAADSYTYTGGEQTSTTASAAQYMSYKGTVANSNYTIPSAVTGSTGGASAQNYAGVATAISSATTVTPTTANTTYYAVYTEDLTFYYYNGSSHTSTKGVRRMLSNGNSYSNSLSITEPTPSAYDGASYVAWSYDSSNYASSYRRTPLATGVNSLYAIYEKTIKVSYNANNGSGAPSQQSGTKSYVSKSGGINTYNPSITISNTKPTRTGYTFSMWNSASNGSGTSYTGGTAYSIGSDLTLYAIWTVDTYTVQYSCGTGSDTPPTTQTVNYDQSITIASNTCTKTGYTFSKWSDPTGDTFWTGWTGTWKYVNGQYGITNNTLTLTAVWTANTYTIGYTLNGGTKGTNGPTSGTYNQDVIISNPTKIVTVTGNVNGTGATVESATSKAQIFAGWTSTTVGSNAKTGASASPSTAWNGSSIKNTYFRNLRESGTVTMVANWTAVAFNLPTVAKTGYTCKWNTNADGSGTSYNSGASYTPSANSSSSVTLYAVCTINTYTISYDANGGTGAPSNQTKTYGVTLTLSSTKPTRTGYTFLGWSTSATATDATYSAGASYTANASAKLYAVWQCNKYTVNYDANVFANVTNKTTNGVTISYDGATSYLTLDGTLTASTTIATFLPKTFIEGEQYKISLTYVSGTVTSTANNSFPFDVHKGGSNLSTRNYKSLQFPTSGTNSTILTISELAASEGEGIRAWIWPSSSGAVAFNNYVIKVNFTKVESENINYGDYYRFPENPTRMGYTFNGWYTSESGGAQVTSDTLMSTRNNHTLYAKWTVNKVYINYHVNGGTVTATTTSSSGTTYNWTTVDGIVYLNGSKYTQSLNYGTSTNSNGLPNYNNSKFLNITRTGYFAPDGAEWICSSGCTTANKTYDQDVVYTASDFCDASNGNCTVVLKVNWKLSMPSFTYTGTYKIVDDSNNVISDFANYQGNWKIRFLTSGTLTFSALGNASSGIDIFVVAGGGNGALGGIYGSPGGGGGGGGASITVTKFPVETNVSYNIVVGSAKSNSSFGKSGTAYYTALAGSTPDRTYLENGIGWICYQGAGGAGRLSGQTSNYGATNVTVNVGGTGDGRYSAGDLKDGTDGTYEFNGTSGLRYGAGGGAGGKGVSTGSGGTGRSGSSGNNDGGGTGGQGCSFVFDQSIWANKLVGAYSGSPATANTGSGGGGGGAMCGSGTNSSGNEGTGGAGGSGIVIIRNTR